jgi:hypothetical protein
MYYYNYYKKPYSAIEVHYFLKEDMHSMDAFIQHNCEHDLLILIKEVARTFNIEIIVDTVPFAEGGLKRQLNILAKQENSKAIITAAVVSALITTIIVTPITTSLTKITEKVIEKIFEDSKEKEIKDENLKLENERLKQEIKLNNQKLENNSMIEKTRAKFYKRINNYAPLYSVSFTSNYGNKEILNNEVFVSKEEFGLYTESVSFFQVDSKLIESEIENNTILEIDDAQIEITSPDFSGRYMWKGKYNQKKINFLISDTKFLDDVQMGNLVFTKGTILICILSIDKLSNSEKVKSYNVTLVKKIINED